RTSPASRRRDYSESHPIPGQQHARVWYRRQQRTRPDTCSSPHANPGASGSVPAASTPEIVINLGANSSSSGSTPEVVLNLAGGNSDGSGPELTIDINNTAGANATNPPNPEVVLNLGGSTPEIAFNFANGSGNGNSLAEIILNLNNGGSQPPQASGIQINVVV